MQVIRKRIQTPKGVKHILTIPSSKKESGIHKNKKLNITIDFDEKIHNPH